MREIKFRAWHETNKEMVYFEPKDLVRDEYQSQALAQLMLEKSKFLMQFTGLKDKNGIEIYEGDIIQSTCKHSMGRMMKFVWNADPDFDNMGWVLEYANADNSSNNYPQLKYWGFKTWFYPKIEVKVIGNIYENPELFKNKEQE